MSVYVIASLTIKDAVRFEDYRRMLLPTMATIAPAVTAEAAGSSPVVPAIPSKALALILAKPSRTQKGHGFVPFFVSIFRPANSVGGPHAATPPDTDGSDVAFASHENTNDKTAA